MRSSMDNRASRMVRRSASEHGSQAISSLVEPCRCQVNTESPYASTLNNRKRQETKPACRTLHASSRACANRRQIAAVKPTDAQSVDSRRHGG